MGELPTGAVTLLLADVEGSTRLWETQPDGMTVAVARLDQAMSDLVTIHGGVRPVEQGKGDSFVIAFARASDAVAYTLDLQRAPLARSGCASGSIPARCGFATRAITSDRRSIAPLGCGSWLTADKRCCRARPSLMVVDRTAARRVLTDLGTHLLHDLARSEQVMQLCHPDLRNEFPPLRTREVVVSHNLPAQFTGFVGRPWKSETCARPWRATAWSPSPAPAGRVRHAWPCR